MSSKESNRYSRQTVLKEIGPDGQKLLNQSKVIIVGCGALGTNSANLLCRAGIGEVCIIDRDIIECGLPCDPPAALHHIEDDPGSHRQVEREIR